ncbi:MAG: Sir2 family NAD-dependent protein deacetylase [Planctomycetota bacterium]|jgi:NAD-dependent deacetylase
MANDGTARGGPRVAVLTGAGISADSGLPTFRDAGGLWEGRRPEEVATPEAWLAEPELVWRFYQQRRSALGGVEPNAAHRALAAAATTLAERGGRLDLITQNVDDLHQRAGSDPLCMHGELAVLRCPICRARVRDLEHLDPAAFVPCEACGHDRLRPDVVWFGEVPYFLEDIERILLDADHFVSIGTSGAVYPAAGFLAAARQLGKPTWVQSLDEPDNLDPRDRFFPGRAVERVPELLGELLAL